MIRLDKLTTGEPRPDAPSLCQATFPAPLVLPSGWKRAGSRGNSARFRYLKPDKWDGSATRRRPDLTKYNSSCLWHRQQILSTALLLSQEQATDWLIWAAGQSCVPTSRFHRVRRAHVFVTAVSVWVCKEKDENQSVYRLQGLMTGECIYLFQNPARKQLKKINK